MALAPLIFSLGLISSCELGLSTNKSNQKAEVMAAFTGNVYDSTSGVDASAHPWYWRVYNNKIIGTDNSSTINALESALNGGEIFNNIFQDKRFGIGIWGGVASGWNGTIPLNKISIHNTISVDVNRASSFAQEQPSL